MSEVEKNLYSNALNMQEELVSHRRYLHQNPELGLDLPITTKYVKEKLVEMGYKPEDCGPSGIVVTVGGKKEGKVFMIRGDMDGLPIKEELDIEFKSKNENMHACGHDMHTSMMLGAAKLLKEIEDELQGSVKLMFQPAEEVLLGARSMIEAGLLENPKVDAAMMIHVMAGFPLPTGMVIVPESGVGTTASDWFEIHVKGKGGHGAIPNTTVDPLNIAAHIHLSLQAVNSREIAPGETGVLTVGMMKGGTASNIIPDSAELHGTIRTINPDARDFIKKRVVEISESVGQAFRGKVDAKIIDGTPSVINDKGLVDLAERVLPKVFGQSIIPARALGQAGRISGSEDFGYVSEKVPTIMFALGAGNSEEGYKHSMHHPKVRFDEAALSKGATLYAYMAKKWLEENA